MISKLPRWIWVGAAFLALSAGMVNAIAFSAFPHKAATHITGTFSFLSIALFEHDVDGAMQSFFVLFCFFIGALISGIIIHDGHLRMGRRYGFALLVELTLLLLSTYGFRHSLIWGEYFASIAAGLQNAMVSTYSGAIVRTTHMTGNLSDFGALLGNQIRGAKTKLDVKRIQLLSIIMFSFFFGGLLGVFSYAKLDTLAMLAPAAMIAFSALCYELLRRRVTGKM